MLHLHNCVPITPRKRKEMINMGDGELKMLESLLHTVDQLPDVPSREILLTQLAASAESCMRKASDTTKGLQAVLIQIHEKQASYPGYQEKVRRSHWEQARKSAAELDGHYLRFKGRPKGDPIAVVLMNWRGTELWWEPVEDGEHWDVFKQLTPESRLLIKLKRMPFDPKLTRTYGWDDFVSIEDLSKRESADDVLLESLLAGCPSVIRRVRSSPFRTVGDLLREPNLANQRGMGRDTRQTLKRTLLIYGFTPTW